jgi:hypothetical protein
VRSRQRKPRHIVVELRTLPPVHAVAGFARGRKTGRNVIHGFRRVVILQVARNASGTEPRERSACRAFVTCGALEGAMRANERKPVRMLLHGLRPHCPTLDGVAGLAIGTELPPVDIRVTGRAGGPHRLEDGLDMTVLAQHSAVHPTQGVLSVAIVIELWNGPDWTPTGRGMTLLTCHL